MGEDFDLCIFYANLNALDLTAIVTLRRNENKTCDWIILSTGNV